MYNIRNNITTPRRPKTAPKTATRSTLLPSQAGAALAATGRVPEFGKCTITGIILDLLNKKVTLYYLKNVLNLKKKTCFSKLR